MQDAEAVTDDLQHVAIADEGDPAPLCLESMFCHGHASISALPEYSLTPITSCLTGDGNADEGEDMEEAESGEHDEESDFTEEEEDREVQPSAGVDFRPNTHDKAFRCGNRPLDATLGTSTATSSLQHPHLLTQVKRDLQQFGIYRALPVHGEPDYASGPPTSAEEYLRRVRSAFPAGLSVANIP